MRLFFLSLLAVLGLLAPGASAQIDYLSGLQEGRITYYEQSPTVACDIPMELWPSYTAALSEKHFQGGLACGATVRLKKGDKEIQAMVVDLCPVFGNEEWCSGDKPHFDLGGTQTFSQLEPPLTGVTDITFEWLPTPVGDSPVEYRLKDGINAWWVAIQVLNHRYPVTRLELQESGSSQWIEGNRKLEGMWNYWQFDFSGNGLQPPFKLRITDQYGQVLEDVGEQIAERYQWAGQGQFPLRPEHQEGAPAQLRPSVKNRLPTPVLGTMRPEASIDALGRIAPAR